jgi:hypothetical protein
MNRPRLLFTISRFARDRLPSAPKTGFGDLALLLAYLAGLLLLVGIFAPSFTMIPKFGNGFFERLVRLFVSSDLEPRQFSLIGGILHLFQQHELFVGAIILLFSVAFPVAKLAAIVLFLHRGPSAAGRYLKLLESLGKWSMLDVFVIASLVICFKGFPGGTHIQVQWGIYVFAISILLTMQATYALKRHVQSGRAYMGNAMS